MTGRLLNNDCRWLLAPAVAAVLCVALSAPANAATDNYTYAYDPTQLQCGSFGLTVSCVGSQAIAPLSTAVGDHIVITATTSAGQPIQVPGSSTSSLVIVQAFDATATFGPGAPNGAIHNIYQVTPQGFVSAPGAPPPIEGPFATQHSFEYHGFFGYCCGYGVPTTGFSLTGLSADLTVTAADPLPIVGLSIGYTYSLDSLPVSYTDLAGGTPDSPLLLRGANVSQITGQIGGASTTEFYNFNWNGGLFQGEGRVLGASAGDTFAYELFDTAAGAPGTSVWLNGDVGFSQTISQVLAPGNYTIGLVANAPADPQFVLDFMTPVGGGPVPEPAIWAMMLLGFGGLGAVMRSRRRMATVSI